MPVSDFHAVSDIMGEIQRLSPRTVLDIGVGFGKWGVLCREILDARFGRCRRDQWEEVRIVGYEAWGQYENPAWGAYNVVVRIPYVGQQERGWGVVLMIDVLEHFAPERGRQVLSGLVKQNAHVIVSVPNGPMEQGETFGNPYEAHRWTFNGVEEFKHYKFKLIHQSVCTVVSIEGNG
jgi:hypothetical protein